MVLIIFLFYIVLHTHRLVGLLDAFSKFVVFVRLPLTGAIYTSWDVIRCFILEYFALTLLLLSQHECTCFCHEDCWLLLSLVFVNCLFFAHL